MPPSRPKMHSKSGKVKNLPKVSSPPSVSNELPSTSSGQRDSDVDQQFELELCWCIHQLENTIASGKLNQKQAQDTEKTLKTLKSSSQPLIKKRQIMRTTFGDYRKKMAEEQKKMGLGSRQIKFTDPAKATQKSFFVKKSSILTSGKDFKFNFPVNEIENLNISENDVKPSTSVDTSQFHFTPSNNTFTFNFSVDENQQ